MYGRAADRMQPWSKTRFSDAEIIRRVALSVDVDPVRVTGINSTDEELASAISVAEHVAEYLLEHWGIEPLFCMSGNGGQLIYLIDEPADSTLVHQVLKHLHEKFSTDNVKIGTSVHEPSRITRMVGTLNMKGDSVEGRPRRVARILKVPADRRIVTTEQLEMLVPEPTQETEQTKAGGKWTNEKLRSLLENQYKAFGGHDWGYQIEDNPKYGTMYKLQQCPFVQHHVEYRAALWINDGTLCYKCFSDDCDGENKKTGRDFVNLVAPEPPLALTDELRLARHVVTKFSHHGAPTIRANKEREQFVPRDTVDQVIAACNDVEFKLVIALARYAGLRCPSELSLTWADVDWDRGRLTVRSPKTAHHAGKELRVIPLFYELRPHLEAVRAARAGSTSPFILSEKYRRFDANLRTPLRRILDRLGLKPWPKLFQNLRASRATEFATDFAPHIAAAWAGHSEKVAEQHYWRVNDEDIQKALQKCIQQPDATSDIEWQADTENPANSAELLELAGCSVLPVGIEPTTY